MFSNLYKSKRILSLSAMLLAMCLLSNGCIKQKLVVKVRPDGTGQVMLSIIYSQKLVAMQEAQMQQMRQVMAQNNGSAAVTNSPYYNPRMLRFMGRLFGSGVTLSQSREYDKNGDRGFLALYNFKDINALKFNAQMSMYAMMMSQMSMGMQSSGQDEDALDDQMDEQMEQMMSQFGGSEEETVTFKLTKGDKSQLDVILPAMDAPLQATDVAVVEESVPAPQAVEFMAVGDNPFGFTGQETESQMMQKMMEGMSLSMDVELLSSDAEAKAATPHPSKKNRWIIYNMDFETIMADKRVFGAMKTMQETSMMDGEMQHSSFGLFSEIPGATVQTNSFSITF